MKSRFIPFGGLGWGILCFVLSGCWLKNIDNKQEVLVAIHHFNMSPFVHPKMVWELMPWMSDTEDQILALSVSGAEGSNRYFEEIQQRDLGGEDGKKFIFYDGRNDEHLQFGYVYHGKSESDIHVLETVESSGGSGVFISLFLCKLEFDPQFEIINGVLRENGKHEVLKLIKVISLGDRWMGEIQVKGNILQVGRDEGRFGKPDGLGFEISLGS